MGTAGLVFSQIFVVGYLIPEAVPLKVGEAKKRQFKTFKCFKSKHIDLES